METKKCLGDNGACPGDIYAKGVCKSHYKRQRDGYLIDSPIGKPGQRRKKFDTDLDRFWSKVDKSNDCWEWLGTKPPSLGGRGTFSVETPARRSLKAHVWIFEQLFGKADGCVVQICDNLGCVNPDHLADLTHSEKDRLRTDKIEPTAHMAMSTRLKTRTSTKIAIGCAELACSPEPTSEQPGKVIR